MAKTIIQTIGPLYGEPINGTVFGRPNGSVFVPAVNTISISLSDFYIKNQGGGAPNLNFCNASGVRRNATFVAESQDISSYMVYEVASDSEFSSVIASSTRPAGQFNVSNFFVPLVDPETVIEAGTKYYLRARLVASTNVDVAVSAVIELTGFVE
jgi:hypothetical protein